VESSSWVNIYIKQVEVQVKVAYETLVWEFVAVISALFNDKVTHITSKLEVLLF